MLLAGCSSYRSKGFGPWIVNYSRPIIVHGLAKAGKMIKGEHEIKVVGAGGKKVGARGTIAIRALPTATPYCTDITTHAL